MRRLLVLAPLLFAAAGCPTTQRLDRPGAGDGGAGKADAGPDGGACVDLSGCPVTFRYPAGDAESVELRGDFAENGWEVGVKLQRRGDWFEASLELEDGRTVHYKFVVDGAWVTDPENSNTAPDGQGGENSVRTVSCDDCSPAAFDWRDGIMYFVFVDRFADGDPENNAPVADVAPEANYHGGDLAGVLAKIEEGYFSDLGVNVLWLTAPLDNADGFGVGDDGRNYSAYHGYWPRDLEAVEPRLGSRADLEAVVAAAHEAGIRVVLDYVMNHVHIESPLYADHPEWFWPLEKPGGGQCVCGGGCAWGGDEGRRCWFRPYLPDFDFTSDAARAYSVKNAITWASELGVDGYRLDAVKHIELSWIRDLRSRLRAEIEREGETFYLVGETFDGDPGLIGSYVDPDVMLDGQFDFPMRAELARVILRRDGSMYDLDGFLEENDGNYHERAVMGTFIGNHDLPRSIHLAEDAPLFGEWDSGKSRSWEDRPALPDYAAPFERLAVAYAFLMTTPGLPLIYYGDEIGMAGGGDPDNRRPMQWEGLSEHQIWLRERLRELTRLRAAHPALRRGTRTAITVSEDGYVYRMTGESETIYVALNRGDAEIPASGIPAGNYRELTSGDDVTAPLSIPPRAALVLVSSPE